MIEDSRAPHEESRNRLDNFHKSQKGMLDAAAAAIEKSVIKPEAFGYSKQQILDAISSPAHKLESVGVEAPALEAIVRLTGRPPLIVRNNAVEIERDLLKDFPADIDVQIKNAEVFVPSAGRVEFVNHTRKW